MLQRAHGALEAIYPLTTYAAVLTGLRAPIELLPHVGEKVAGAAARSHPRAHDIAMHADMGLHGLIDGLFEKHGVLEHWGRRHLRAIVEPHRVSRSRTINRALHARSVAHRAIHGLAGVVGAVRAAAAVQRYGSAALVRTQEGRGGALQAAGGALAVVHHPYAQLASTGLMGVALMNDFGLFGRDPTHG